MKGGKVGISWRSRGSAQPGLQRGDFSWYHSSSLRNGSTRPSSDRYVADRGHQRKTEPSQTLDQHTRKFIVSRHCQTRRAGNFDALDALPV
jgi:hypothetical protein